MAGQIALNKPSGGQLILSPEDGASTETVTIPSGGVMAADAPTGKILQVVQVTATASTVDTTTPTSVVTASITIQSGSKVYASVVGDMNPTASSNWHYYQIYRDSTAVSQRYIGQSSTTSYNLPFAHAYLDSPSSSGTYSYSMKVWSGSGGMTYGETGDMQGPTMILMEVAA